jgi:hypothetical protein
MLCAIASTPALPHPQGDKIAGAAGDAAAAVKDAAPDVSLPSSGSLLKNTSYTFTVRVLRGCGVPPGSMLACGRVGFGTATEGAGRGWERFACSSSYSLM